MKPAEYEKIYDFYSETNCKKLSEYARKILLQKPVVIIYRNQTAEDFLSAANDLKKDLNAAIKILHAAPGFSKQIVVSKVEEICLRMNEIYELWSRK